MSYREEEKQEAVIRRFLLETEQDDDVYIGTAHSDDSEIDHVSESDHKTDTEADDTDADPDFHPGAESDTDSDIILPTDDEEPVTHRGGIRFRSSVSAIQQTTPSSTSRNSMDFDVGSPDDNVDQVIETVIQGAGNLENVFVGRDGETVWKSVPIVATTARARPTNIIRRLPGPKNAAKNAKTPLECFELMIDDELLEIIVTCTNVYIENKVDRLSRQRDGRQTDKQEMKAFFGLLLLAGAMRSGHQNLEEMWAKDGFGIEVFYCTMSLRRFQFLLQSIRFDSIIDRQARRALDKLAAFRNVFDLFIRNCVDNYVPSSFTTIDEQLVAFRGRCPFRQFMKSKPAKYGIKIFTLTDSKMFYVHNMEVYVGNQPENSPFLQSNKPRDVVLRLVKHIQNTGRNVTADNWFSSIPLVNDLTSKGLTYVGTLRKNKRELPPELVSKKTTSQSSIFGFHNNMSIVSYAPKQNRSVVLISSMHFDAAIDVETGDMRKPEIITFYNSTKSGVDVVDEKCGTYSTSRRCLRWPLVLFYRLLDIAGINAQVIHLYNSNEAMPRRKFLRQIGYEMVKPNVARRGSTKTLPRTLRSTIMKVASGQVTPQQAPSVNRPAGSRIRCVICPRTKDTKTTQKCSKCQRPMCLSHMDFFCKPCQNTNLETSSDLSE